MKELKTEVFIRQGVKYDMHNGEPFNPKFKDGIVLVEDIMDHLQIDSTLQAITLDELSKIHGDHMAHAMINDMRWVQFRYDGEPVTHTVEASTFAEYVTPRRGKDW